ncbi:MAG: radical SAM protein [Oscillospiraceae bacterium]|jgi:MoaA/NifB/PqqE/SkfB family radical SAM enzyme|nr:radical SAM protein [Oscillospiraceae bacterium]
MSRFSSLTLCLDMFGCPNRCRHCWLGHGPNGRMEPGDLRFLAEAFRPLAKQLEVFSWYREPDYPDNYRELWALEAELSDQKTPHFENLSVWRAARDPDYVPWLASLGVQRCQLTFFGGEAMTDRYTGRKGAWADLLETAERLLAQGIAPRIQVFVNRETVRELPAVEALIRERDWEKRCEAIGVPFSAFVHQGGCDGANAQHYPIWVTPAELPMIPPLLADYSLRHWKEKSIAAVFGQTEAAICHKLGKNRRTGKTASDTPTFYIDRNWDVYPNITAPAPWWRLGNLRRDGAAAIADCYREERSPAQRARRTVPLGQMVRAGGDPESQRLFGEGDYCDYLLNKYCEGAVKE